MGQGRAGHLAPHSTWHAPSTPGGQRYWGPATLTSLPLSTTSQGNLGETQPIVSAAPLSRQTHKRGAGGGGEGSRQGRRARGRQPARTTAPENGAGTDPERHWAGVAWEELFYGESTVFNPFSGLSNAFVLMLFFGAKGRRRRGGGMAAVGSRKPGCKQCRQASGKKHH